MTFRSHLGKRLTEYLNLRRSLGFDMETQASALRSFDAFVASRHYRGPVTQRLVLAFATDDPQISRHECWRRYQFVRQFSDYLATFDESAPRLDPKALPRARQRPPVHIYTDDELAAILRAARRVSWKFPFVGTTLYTIIGLAASSGLRVSEVVQLDRDDVDLQRGILQIRQTKFRKDRLVPIHRTTVARLRSYARARDARFGILLDPAFFVSITGRRLHTTQVDAPFLRVLRRIGLRGKSGAGPRFHGLRHRFAVRRLESWYRDGADLQAMLPVLATYMGHAQYTDTAYYLTSTSELLSLAAERYHPSLPQTRLGR